MPRLNTAPSVSNKGVGFASISLRIKHITPFRLLSASILNEFIPLAGIEYRHFIRAAIAYFPLWIDHSLPHHLRIQRITLKEFGAINSAVRIAIVTRFSELILLYLSNLAGAPWLCAALNRTQARPLAKSLMHPLETLGIKELGFPDLTSFMLRCIIAVIFIFSSFTVDFGIFQPRRSVVMVPLSSELRAEVARLRFTATPLIPWRNAWLWYQNRTTGADVRW